MWRRRLSTHRSFDMLRSSWRIPSILQRERNSHPVSRKKKGERRLVVGYEEKVEVKNERHRRVKELLRDAR